MPKPLQNRIGQQRGKLIVIEDNGGERLKCRCECGRDIDRPRAMFKPSYKGTLSCEYCAGIRCEICSAQIPHRSGMPAKTCSPTCAAERHRRIERARYDEIKFTPQYLAHQQRARAAFRHRMQTDPEFYARMRRNHRATLYMHRQRIKQDPTRYAAALSAQRVANAAYLAATQADPLRALQKNIRQRLYYQLVEKPKRSS